MHALLQPAPALFALFGLLFGLLFGSFLNVVRLRLPAGESIVHPGSHCPHCQRLLAWWQNLPVLSWILLRGRCHFCRQPISPAYPLMELATAALWACAAAASAHQPAPLAHALAVAVFCWLMLLLAALDWQHLWLPDRITWPAIALGLLWQGLRANLAPAPVSPLVAELLHSSGLQPTLPSALLAATLAALVGAAIVLVIRLTYWLVRRREGMGLGDAKLMAALGAWLGFTAMLDSFLIAVFAASAAALLWMLFGKLRRSATDWAAMPLPLGTFLALAAIAEIFHPGWLLHLWLRFSL